MVIPVAPVLATNMVLGGSGFALSAMAKAVAGLYGVATDINEFLNRHIQEMQSSSNATIATTGRILEMAKYGFGLGYLSSVTIIAVGQLLLGNTFAAVATAATAATMSNPIAMTCGAVGAIVYGWSALSDEERNALLDRLSSGLEIGVELIRAIIAFVISKAKELLSSQVLKDFKHYIADKAALFGRSLSDVTHSTVDLISDAASSVKRHAESAIASTAKVAGEASDRVGETFSDLGRVAGKAMDNTGIAAKQALDDGKVVIRRVRGDKSSK